MVLINQSTETKNNPPRRLRWQKGKVMNEKLKELCKIVGVDPEMMEYNRMTTDEILACIHCDIDDDGEIIDIDTGKETGIWYEEIEY